MTSHELKEGGADTQVLEENKQEYIDLMVAWRLDRGVSEQMQYFMKGFTEIMPQILVQQFDAQEIEFIIAGTLEIDVDDWKANTEYRNGMCTCCMGIWILQGGNTYCMGVAHVVYVRSAM